MNSRDPLLTRRTVLGLGLGTALTAVLVACGSDDSSSATTGAPSTTGATTTPTTAAAGSATTPTSAGSAGSTTTSDSATTRTVDTINGPVEIPTNAQRIVCIGFVDTACLLDLGVTPIGMSTSGVNFLPEYAATMADITEVTVAETGDLNLELIASLKPDLILGSDWLDPSKRFAPYEKLAAIAPTALCEWQQAAGNWPEQAVFFADVIGRSSELEALNAEYESRADAVQADHADVLAANTWAVVQGGGEGEWTFYTPHSSHGQVFGRAGAKFADIETGEPGGFLSISNERIGDLAAATAIAINMNESAAAGSEVLLAEPLFKTLPAAQSQQVYPMTWFFPSSYKVALALLEEIDGALEALATAG